MLQSHILGRAGELAYRLCRVGGGRLQKVFFCSSGSEGIEAAIKFARAHTRREGLLCAEGAFHGLTCGALSLMGDSFWKGGFGSLLSGTQQIPFNDLTALEEQLRSKRYAGFLGAVLERAVNVDCHIDKNPMASQRVQHTAWVQAAQDGNVGQFPLQAGELGHRLIDQG